MLSSRVVKAVAVLGAAGVLGLVGAPAAVAGTVDSSAHYYAADGNTNDGDSGPALVWNGTPSYVAGASGNATDKAFGLNGSSDITSPDPTVVNYGTRDFSAYLRFQTSSFTQMDILSKRANCGVGNFFDLRTIVYNGAGYIRFELQDANNPNFEVQVPFAFNDGAYHTVFISRNKSNVTLNVDGTSATAATSGIANLDTNGVLTVGGGACSDPATTDGTARLTGAVDSAFFGVTVPPAAALPDSAYPVLLGVTALGLGGAALGLRRRRLA